MSPAGLSRGYVGAEKAGCASGVGGTERPRPARRIPKPAFHSPASVTSVPNSAPRLRVPAPASCSTPPPPQSPPLSISPPRRPEARGEARAPAPRPRPPPPARPTPSARQAARAAPGLAPRASCGGGGAERRQAQPGRWGGQRHRQRRGGSKRGDVEGGTEPGQRRTRPRAPGREQRAAGAELWAPRGASPVVCSRPCTELPPPQPSSRRAEGTAPAGPRSPDSS